jgi:hypothetical protein
MEKQVKKGSGQGRLYPPSRQPQFVPPRVFRPSLVRIERDRLWATPSTQPAVQPPPSAWRNFADTDPKHAGMLRGIASEYGPLTPAASTEEGESLALWRELIRELRQLAGAWTRDGAEASHARKLEISTLAGQVQDRLAREHDAADGKYASFGSAGFGMVCTGMGQWWRLSAIASVYGESTFRRCRWCQCWFTMQGRRGDAGYCSELHRNYNAQQLRIPDAMGWWGLV